MAPPRVSIMAVALYGSILAPEASGNIYENAALEPQLACSVSRLVLSPTDTVTVHVFLSDHRPEAQSQFSRTWVVTGGSIQDLDQDALWEFIDQPPGEYSATIRVESIGAESAECSVRVFVEGPPTNVDTLRSLPRETGAALLTSVQSETLGYGLYTYIILAARPTTANRVKYEQFLAAFLNMVPDIARLEHHIPPSELNVAYVPVTESPTEELLQKDLAGFILENYDYGRARVLLRSVPGTHRDGPYIVSAPAPITGVTQVQAPYVEQDFTLYPAELAPRVVKEFLIQAAQERFDDTRALPQLALRMQATVSVLAEAWPDIEGALKGWMNFVN